MSEKGSGRRSPDRDTGEWGSFPSAHTQVWCHNVRRHFSCCYAARVAHPGLLALFLFLRIVLSTQVHRIIYKRCSVMHHHLYSRPLIHKKKLLLDLFLTEESFLLLFFRFEITNKWFRLEIMIAGPQQTLNKWCLMSWKGIWAAWRWMGLWERPRFDVQCNRRTVSEYAAQTTKYSLAQLKQNKTNTT